MWDLEDVFEGIAWVEACLAIHGDGKSLYVAVMGMPQDDSPKVN